MVTLKTPDIKVVIKEAIGGDPSLQESLIKLHKEFFPQYDQYLPYMEKRLLLPPIDGYGNIEHWWVLEYDKQPVGFIMFKYVPRRDCSLGLLIAVKPAFRRLSVGQAKTLADYLIKASLEQLRQDALSVGRSIPVGMVVEVETGRLLQVYRDYGFIEIPVDYCSPPYIQGEISFENREELDKLEYLKSILGIFPLEEAHADLSDPKLISKLVLAFLVDHYHLPEDHSGVCRILESIHRTEDLRPI